MADGSAEIVGRPMFIREKFDEIGPRGETYIAKGLIPREGVGHLTGPSGVGKSFLALDWALNIAAGREVLGRRTKRCGVIYVASEAANGVRRRIGAWRTAHQGEVGLPFEMIGQAPNLRDDTHIDNLLWALRLAADDMEQSGHRLGLIVIDTLAMSMVGADENTAADVSPVLANVGRLAAGLGAFVLLVSHTGKETTKGIRGWSGQQANADCVIMLDRDKGSVTTVGELVKLKDGESGAGFAFTLKKVALGFDDDGDEISSCVVAYDEGAVISGKARRKPALSPDQIIVQRALAHVTDFGVTYPVPDTVRGVKPWMRAVTRGDVKTQAMATGLADPDAKPNTVSQKFTRALKELVAKQVVRMEGVYLWLSDPLADVTS